MGNASPHSIDSTLSFGAPGERTRVLLRLNDVRNVLLAPDEEFYGVIGADDSVPDVALVRQESPAEFTVSGDTVLTLEFRVAVAGGNPPVVHSAGEVRLPLAHLSKRCGRSLYHLWFPLGRVGSTRHVPSENSLEHFDKALKIAARDPRAPIVCLSLCLADTPEAEAEYYELGTAPCEKALRFEGLMQSHMQHRRLLEALYRQTRPLREGGVPTLRNLEDALPGQSTSPRSLRLSTSESHFESVGSNVLVSPSPSWNRSSRTTSEELLRLRREIEFTVSEANARINQAGDAILKLTERLSAREAEHDRIRRETSQMRLDADALELENARRQQEICSLEERARADAMLERERVLEKQQLSREAETLREQKEALVLILEDLYGAVKDRGPGRPNGLGAARASDDDEAWTNLLPAPSDLLEGHVPEGDL
eukprot:NODE_5252_length_1792_cov_3.534535.p1 GENE.NODE_5252_length_1792_cov_3.534535~~NODE_5252_length_1792_cov_3.534535.p1  ORF type:complete len:426 (+),score=120.17 NODE_5252_length_1792_cov_3.534535:206-1483(+)